MTSCARPAGPPRLPAPRRPSLRQRPHSPGPRAQQGPEGFRRQVQDHGRLRRSLRSRLRLPRPAHRDQGRRAAGPQEAGDARAEVLDACRAYAQKYVDLQTSQFERIGCFGRWDKPYKTMARDYEARTLEAFYGFLEKGFVYRGLKPVYWCIHDRTALAEAEVEYEHAHQPLDLRPLPAHLRPGGDRPGARRHARSPPSSGPPLPGPCPRRWPSPSIPTSNTSRCGEPPTAPVYIVAAAAGRVRSRPPASSAQPTETRPLQRQRARPRHLPASLPRPQHPRRLATYVTADTGHRRRPHRARPRRRRLLHRPALRPRPHLPRRRRRPHPRRPERLEPRRAARLRRHEGLGRQPRHRRHA